jgi:hypothetical protein
MKRTLNILILIFICTNGFAQVQMSDTLSIILNRIRYLGKSSSTITISHKKEDRTLNINKLCLWQVDEIKKYDRFISKAEIQTYLTDSSVSIRMLGFILFVETETEKEKILKCYKSFISNNKGFFILGCSDAQTIKTIAENCYFLLSEQNEFIERKLTFNESEVAYLKEIQKINDQELYKARIK